MDTSDTKRKVLVFTGTRADIGILLPLIRSLSEHPTLSVGVLVGGEHSASSATSSDLDMSAAPVVGRLDAPDDGTTVRAVTTALGRATTSAAVELERLQPDVVVVLGDRYEALAVTQACLIARVAVAHVHGGELTGGVIDEPIRHAITKMSHLHFVAAEPFRRRVVQLGEAPERTWTVGSPGIDGLREIPHVARDRCCRSLGVDPAAPFVLATYHPLSLHVAEAHEVAEFLEGLRARPEISVMVTGSNRDTGGDAVARALAEFVEESPSRRLVPSLGRTRYIQAMRHCLAVVGNSSSGLIDAPAVGVPSIDVGDRQRGRLRASSVVHVEPDRNEIAKALDTVADPTFRQRAEEAGSPYGTGDASRRIADILATVDLGVQKRFHDIV